jgi:energy-coupling factor transporter ATP-binding protein EcfA2
MAERSDRKEFEIRADFIDNQDLLDWTVENEQFQQIQKKLFEKGAILLAGPRGSGKTHHMKVAYNKSLRGPGYPLTIYVSFGKYYHLEPLLFKSPRAYQIFHTWILGKIILGCQQVVDDLNDTEQKRYSDLGISGRTRINLKNTSMCLPRMDHRYLLKMPMKTLKERTPVHRYSRKVGK